MTVSSTTAKTPDNQIITIPNDKIWGDIITDITGSATRRAKTSDCRDVYWDPTRAAKGRFDDEASRSRSRGPMPISTR